MIPLLLGLALASPVVVPSSADMQIDADEQSLVEDAYTAMAEGRLVEAADLFGSLADGGAGEAARVVQGALLYEAGDLRGAEAALSTAKTPEGRNVLGLVLRERGEAERARRIFEELARGSGDVATMATLNLIALDIDAGHTTEAQSALDGLSVEGLAADEAAALSSRVSSSREEGGASGLDAVGAHLRRGALVSASAELDRMRAVADTRRERVDVGLAQGAIHRASGRPDDAARTLTDTLALARESGLVWQTAQALFGLGMAHHLAGRDDLALTFLAEAEATHRGAGFHGEAVQVAIELGRLALRLGRVEIAEERLAEAQSALASMSLPPANAAAKELEGGIAAQRGDISGAADAYGVALEYRVASGHYAEAARVATAVVRMNAVESPKRDFRQALTLFSQAGDDLGPAHVELAYALGRVHAEDLETALVAFAKAAELAEETGHGDHVVETASRNAAQALILLGASEDAATLAVGEGVAGAVEHHRTLIAALKAYDQGLTAYGAGDFKTARSHFFESSTELKRIGEADYAKQAEKAYAWCAYNIAVGLPAEKSWPFWSDVIAEAQRLDDVELEARATAASAMVAVRLGMTGNSRRLGDAAEVAARAGLPDLAARCLAELAEQPGDLPERARHARSAFGLAPDDPATQVAVYNVAVDAYNGEQYELARDLAELGLTQPSDLKEPLEAILEATAGY